MQSCSGEFREALTKEMNFEQLYEFKHLVSSQEKEAHKLWQTILSLPKKSEEEIRTMLKTQNIAVSCQENFLFAIAMHEEIKKIGLKISELPEPLSNPTNA